MGTSRVKFGGMSAAGDIMRIRTCPGVRSGGGVEEVEAIVVRVSVSGKVRSKFAGERMEGWRGGGVIVVWWVARSRGESSMSSRRVWIQKGGR